LDIFLFHNEKKIGIELKFKTKGLHSSQNSSSKKDLISTKKKQEMFNYYFSVLDARLTFREEGKSCVFTSKSEDFIIQSIFKSETKEWIDIVGTEAKIATRTLSNISDEFRPFCSDLALLFPTKSIFHS